MTRLEKQMTFLEELDKLKQIGRQTYLCDGSRKENDAEHSWHCAVMALLLAEYAPEGTDAAHAAAMLLLHDAVEIYAGDTYAYDPEGKKTQRQREETAAERLFGLLPEDQAAEYRALWEEFEAWETKEAVFARALDCIQPTMLNNASDGRSWQEHGTRLSQVLHRNRRTHEASEELWAYQREHFIEPGVRKGRLIDDRNEEEDHA